MSDVPLLASSLFPNSRTTSSETRQSHYPHRFPPNLPRESGAFIAVMGLVVAALVMLAACGGGGGGDAFTPSPKPTAAAKLSVLVQPTQGFPNSVLAPSLQVGLQTASGVSVTQSGVSVTVELHSGTASGTILGTLSRPTDANGIASFDDLQLSAIGSYFLRARATSLSPPPTSAITNAVVISGTPPPPQTPTHLAFVTQPSATDAGTPFATDVRVQVRDASGNPVSGVSHSITLSIEGGPIPTPVPAPSLIGTTTRVSASGIATFPAISPSTPGIGYRLRATTTTQGVSDAVSVVFTVDVPLVAAQLAFATQPTSTDVGAAITPAVAMRIENTAGTLVTTASNPITLSLEAGTAGASLASGGPLAANGGVSSFASLSVNAAGVGYRLRATSPGLTDAVSDPFDITVPPGGPVSLRFVNPIPDAVQRGYLQQVEVEVLDANGVRVTNQQVDITISIDNNPGSMMMRAGMTVDTYTVAPVTELIEANQAGYSRCPLGNLGVDGINSLARDATSYRLYLAKEGNNFTGFGLFALDMRTGLETEIRPYSLAAPYDLPMALTVDMSGRLVAGVSGVPNGSGALFQLDPTNGAATALGFVSVPGDSISSIHDLSTNPLSGDIFGICGLASVSGPSVHPGNNSWLLRIDPVTLAGTIVGQLPFESYTLSFLPDGALWVASAVAPHPSTASGPRKVWNVNPATGTATEVTSLLLEGRFHLVGLPGLLRGTVTRSTTNGVATFNNLTMEALGTGYTLQASALGLGAATSSTFSIVPQGGSAPTIQFSPNFQQVSESVGPVTVSYSLSSPRAYEVRCYVLVTGDAWSGADHTLPGPTLTSNIFSTFASDLELVIRIPPGQTSGQITFDVIDNQVVDGTRGLFFKIRTANGATIGNTDTHTLIILDDD